MSITEGPPELPYPKLPFWNAVGLSYSTYFGNFIDVLRASWLWLIVTAALIAFASWQQWTSMAAMLANAKAGLPPQMPGLTGMTALLSLGNFFVLLAGAVSIAVAWHRLMILNEQPGFSGSNVPSKELWRYILVGIAICLISFLPAVLVMFMSFYSLSLLKAPGSAPPSAFFALIPVIFALYAVGGAAALRISLLLPAKAIGDASLTFTQTWNRTRGNTWRLLWGLAGTTLPAMILAEITVLIALPLPNPATLATTDIAVRMTTASTVLNVYYLLILPISIGFLSHAYRHFFQSPLGPPA